MTKRSPVLDAYIKQLRAFEARRRKMRLLRGKGMTVSGIARKFGVSRQRVQQLLRGSE